MLSLYDSMTEPTTSIHCIHPISMRFAVTENSATGGAVAAKHIPVLYSKAHAIANQKYRRAHMIQDDPNDLFIFHPDRIL